MADSTANLQQTLRPPFSLLDCDSNSELMSHMPQLNYQAAAAAAAAAYDQQQNFLYQSIMGYYSDVVSTSTAGDSFGNPQITPDFPLVHPNGIVVDHHPVSVETGTSGFRGSSEAEEEEMKKKKKRKSDAMEDSSTSRNSSPPVSGNTSRPKNVSGRGKRGRSGDVKSEEEKPRDVVHVRAKRGQATDSHSLAERVRRGKINEKLKCLQDMVPGCYKAMGMAVMLDEIINYVQSLQNQVEFLSMKLAAASALQDFNIHQQNPTSTDNNTIQNTKTYHDAAHQQQQQLMIDNLLNEGYNSHHHLQQQLQAALSCIEATWPLI